MAGDIPGVLRGNKLPPEFRGKNNGIRKWKPQEDPLNRRNRNDRPGCLGKLFQFIRRNPKNN